MIAAGDRIELTVEKPAAGGRMIARHEGRVVLVLGAIPGERVITRVESVERKVAFAATADVLEPSSDRRAAPLDALCGGCVYSHIAYSRQRELKSAIVADAFARIARLPLETPIPVAASPERGYRMRARLHVRDGRTGFYREGTHEICDVRQTGQLLEAAADGAARTASVLADAGVPVVSLEIAENIAADSRAIHVELRPGGIVPASVLQRVIDAAVTGCCAQAPGGAVSRAGVPHIADPLEALTGGRATGDLRRHARSFFQANRYLLPELVQATIAEVPAEGDVLDLYAGVGIFSAALAGCGRAGITAVEGDAESGVDLQRNAGQFAGRIRVAVASVEGYLARRRTGPATIIIDPPRTGLSREAADAVVRQRPGRVIYVSCDPPTMARDARRLIDAGYGLRSLRAFDLFPNTPHVESVGVFDRG